MRARRTERIAGVLFTFPILNGVAIIASTDPIVVADAIYPLVIFNCVLFAVVISFPQSLPPVSALPRGPRLLARVDDLVRRVVCGRVLSHGFSRLHFRRRRAVRRRIRIRDPVHDVSSGREHSLRTRQSSDRAGRFGFAAAPLGRLQDILAQPHRRRAHRVLHARLCVPVLGFARRARREMGRHGERAAAAGLLRARIADR